MKKIGAFKCGQWGIVNAFRASYGGANGPVAVVLQMEDGEPLATLSVNMYTPECSRDSSDLPNNCFYVKQWSENKLIALDALNSGLFIERADLPHAESGFVTAPVWQIVATGGSA